MFETMASFMLVEHANGAMFDPPLGPAVYPRTVAPNRRPYRTSDGHIAALIYNDKHWNAFIDAVQPAWATDQYATLEQRANADRRRLRAGGRDACRSAPPRNGWRCSASWRSRPRRSTHPDALFDNPHLNAVGLFETVRDPARPGAVSRCADLVFAHARAGSPVLHRSWAPTPRTFWRELGLADVETTGWRGRPWTSRWGSRPTRCAQSCASW